MINQTELLEAIRKDDSAAYRILFETYYQWLFNYIYKICGNKILAEDLVQETMIKFWEKRKTIQIKTSLKSYLFKICHNEFLQHFRQKKIQFDFLDEVKWDALKSVYEESAEEEENISQVAHKIVILNKLIEEIPPRSREVFILNKLKKRKYKEIATDLDISIKTVESHMSKALKFIKNNANFGIF